MVTFARARRSRGFTLVELMVVVALVVVVGTLAAPAMNRMVATQRVKATASSLQLALVKARSEALKRNATATLSPIGATWTGGWNVSVAGTTVDVTQASAQVTVSAEPAVASVAFRYDGRTTLAGPVAFTVSDASSGTTRCVGIDPAGRPYAREAPPC